MAREPSRTTEGPERQAAWSNLTAWAKADGAGTLEAAGGTVPRGEAGAGASGVEEHQGASPPLW